MKRLVLSGLAIVLVCGCSQTQPRTFRNPIISGFHPDPSICRVGDDYYAVNSSFEYFPGVPVHHSKDLVHWKLIGYCLTRKSQLNLDKSRASGGIYAPTIRYNKGTFYMVTTRVDNGGNFYVTAKDPAGPWSEPVWLDRSGIDPSLFFDDDGTVYYSRHEGQGDGYIGQTTLDLKSGKLTGPVKEIWKGTGGVWAEGPHLYKVNGKYYLMCAEGGTAYEHMVTTARSDSPWGPFVSDPDNPILTHRNQPNSPFQALGHADMVETPDGWWMVFLGIRPQGGQFHHLGRETFLAPVTWTQAGWPVVNGKGWIDPEMAAPRLPEKVWEPPPVRDDFSKASPTLEWNYIRNPYEENYSLTERPGFLRLHGSAVTLSDQDSPTFVGRRQTDLSCRASTLLEFKPRGENEEAGLVVRGNDRGNVEVGVTSRQGKRRVFLRIGLNAQAVYPVLGDEYVGDGNVVLSVKASPLEYEFFYQVSGGQEKSLGKVPTRELSSERIGTASSMNFTGVYIGLYATGNGQKSTSQADFDWFDYARQE
jgi:alpha-N-arabinofuranosidase